MSVVDQPGDTGSAPAPSRRSVDLNTYLPHHITVIANKWARGSSRIYLKRFGIGVNEWRVLSTIAIEPGCTANRIFQLTTVDTAIISRAVKVLESKKMVTATPDPADPRRTLLNLTPAGIRRHDEIMDVALARQRKLFEGLTDREIAQLTHLILRVRGNLNTVNAAEFLDGPQETARR